MSCTNHFRLVAGGGDGAKDLVEEGFLLLASEQGGVSILEKTLATSTRRSPSAAATRHILAQHSITAMAADVGQGLLYFFDRRQGVGIRLMIIVVLCLLLDLCRLCGQLTFLLPSVVLLMLHVLQPYIV